MLEDGRFLVEWQYRRTQEVYEEQNNTFLSEYGTKVLKVTYISHEYRNNMNFQTFQETDDVIATFGNIFKNQKIKLLKKLLMLSKTRIKKK